MAKKQKSAAEPEVIPKHPRYENPLDRFYRDPSSRLQAYDRMEQQLEHRTLTLGAAVKRADAAEAALAARPTWEEIAKLDPIAGGGDEDWRCVWCQASWPYYDIPDKHPDNGCLCPRAQAATRTTEGTEP